MIGIDLSQMGTVSFKRGDASLAVGTTLTLAGKLLIRIRQVPGELPEEVKSKISHLVNFEGDKVLAKVKKVLIESKQLTLMVTKSNQGELFEEGKSEKPAPASQTIKATKPPSDSTPLAPAEMAALDAEAAALAAKKKPAPRTGKRPDWAKAKK